MDRYPTTPGEVDGSPWTATLQLLERLMGLYGSVPTSPGEAAGRHPLSWPGFQRGAYRSPQ